MAWESVPGNDAGRMNGDGSRKLLLHSTEGSTIEGAIGAYRKNNSWPTLTVDCRRRRVVRHLADSVAARSLRNASGGVETNRDGTVLIQIELVGFAINPSTIGSPDDLRWFGEEVVGPLCRRNAIPMESSVRWVPYPDSYGLKASQRLSGAEWDAYSGVLAHQHAPENDHGDTGLIDIKTILSAARGDDDMTPAQAEMLANIEQRSKVMFTMLTDQGDIGRRSKETTIGVRALLARDTTVVLSSEDRAELAELIAADIPDDLAESVIDALHRRTAPAD